MWQSLIVSDSLRYGELLRGAIARQRVVRSDGVLSHAMLLKARRCLKLCKSAITTVCTEVLHLLTLSWHYSIAQKVRQIKNSFIVAEWLASSNTLAFKSREELYENSVGEKMRICHAISMRTLWPEEKHESHAIITIKITNMNFTFSSSVQLLNCEE